MINPAFGVRLQQRLVKTGGRQVRYARYYWLVLAERHLTRRLFGATVRSIAALPVMERNQATGHRLGRAEMQISAIPYGMTRSKIWICHSESLAPDQGGV